MYLDDSINNYNDQYIYISRRKTLNRALLVIGLKFVFKVCIYTKLGGKVWIHDKS